MSVMIIMFIILTVPSLLLFFFLTWAVKGKPDMARKIELVGYGFLIVSLFWTLVVNITSEMIRESEMIEIEERIQMLWSFESSKLEYERTGDLEELSDAHQDIVRHSHEKPDNSYLKSQELVANNINYFLFAMSTVLIAVGRIGEIFGNKSENKKVKRRKFKNQGINHKEKRR